MSVEHATFTIERTYPAAPGAVFRAWADPALKKRWFADAETIEHELDFRIGGTETSRGEFSGGAFEYDARYYDIVEDERIVYAYEMHMDGRRISVSLASVQLAPEAGGTRLELTEHGAFLDGRDDVSTREGGTGSLLDALGELLAAD